MKYILTAYKYIFTVVMLAVFVVAFVIDVVIKLVTLNVIKSDMGTVIIDFAISHVQYIIDCVRKNN